MKKTIAMIALLLAFIAGCSNPNPENKSGLQYPEMRYAEPYTNKP